MTCILLFITSNIYRIHARTRKKVVLVHYPRESFPEVPEWVRWTVIGVFVILKLRDASISWTEHPEREGHVRRLSRGWSKRSSRGHGIFEVCYFSRRRYLIGRGFALQKRPGITVDESVFSIPRAPTQWESSLAREWPHRRRWNSSRFKCEG